MKKLSLEIIQEKLKTLWSDTLKSDTIPTEKTFLEIGGNSVSVFVLLEKIEQELEYTVEPEVFFDEERSSIAQIAKEIFDYKQNTEEDQSMGTYREEFAKNGCIGPFKLMEPEEMKKIWNKVRLQLLRRDTATFKDSKLNYDRHLDIEDLKKVVSSKEIVTILKEIMGDNLKCWRTEWFPKYPGDEGTEWHQAKNFFEFEGEPKVVPTEQSPEFWGCTVWVAFTDATIENGCVKVIPGSHKEMHFDESKKVEHDTSIINNKMVDNENQGFFGYDWEVLKKDADWKPNENEAKYVEMKAGEFFIFTSQVLHGSLPNITEDQTRFGMSIRYVTDDVKVYPDLEEFNALGETLVLKDYNTLSV